MGRCASSSGSTAPWPASWVWRSESGQWRGATPLRRRSGGAWAAAWPLSSKAPGRTRRPWRPRRSRYAARRPPSSLPVGRECLYDHNRPAPRLGRLLFRPIVAALGYRPPTARLCPPGGRRRTHGRTARRRLWDRRAHDPRRRAAAPTPSASTSLHERLGSPGARPPNAAWGRSSRFSTRSASTLSASPSTRSSTAGCSTSLTTPPAPGTSPPRKPSSVQVATFISCASATSSPATGAPPHHRGRAAGCLRLRLAHRLAHSRPLRHQRRLWRPYRRSVAGRHFPAGVPVSARSVPDPGSVRAITTGNSSVRASTGRQEPAFRDVPAHASKSQE